MLLTFANDLLNLVLLITNMLCCLLANNGAPLERELHINLPDKFKSKLNSFTYLLVKTFLKHCFT